jgi:hypothetical protein
MPGGAGVALPRGAGGGGRGGERLLQLCTRERLGGRQSIATPKKRSKARPCKFRVKIDSCSILDLPFMWKLLYLLGLVADWI